MSLYDFETSGRKFLMSPVTSTERKKVLIPTVGDYRFTNAEYNESTNDSLSFTAHFENSCIENVADWFLGKSALSNKKLQKLCYYAYCWFIVFFNDIENCNTTNIQKICGDSFQAWIHGPVCPILYHKYKCFGWKEIPQKEPSNNIFTKEIEELLNMVWETYGGFSAEQLETLSHSEYPWINARKNVDLGDACSNVISDFDILQFYSSL